MWKKMRMIDVLNLMAEGKIEENTTLIVSGDFKEFEYEYLKKYRTFLDEDSDLLSERFNIDEEFLNKKVRLEKKIEKYRINLPHSKFCVGLAYNKTGEKEIIIYVKGSIIEVKMDYFKNQFTEKEFEEIAELQPYKPFKELVKET